MDASESDCDVAFVASEVDEDPGYLAGVDQKLEDILRFCWVGG